LHCGAAIVGDCRGKGSVWHSPGLLYRVHFLRRERRIAMQALELWLRSGYLTVCTNGRVRRDSNQA
jgi:hypothetical protein